MAWKREARPEKEKTKLVWYLLVLLIL